MVSKLLLLDDDKALLDSLSKTISSHYDNIIIIAFDNYKDFLKAYDNLEYDFVITDIIFGDVNSIKVYEKISKDSKIPLIYMSGNDTRTFDVYDTPHEYFLTKPIDNDRLFKAIDKILGNKKFLTFNYFKRSYYVDFNEIIYLESEKRLIHIVTTTIPYLTYGKLDEYVLRVPSNFVRTSKSFVINKNFIVSRVGDVITLKNGDSVIISRTYKKELKDVI